MTIFTSYTGCIFQKRYLKCLTDKSTRRQKIYCYQHQKIILVLVNFQNKAFYSIITNLYTKYTTQSNYLELRLLSKLFQFQMILGYWDDDP